MEKAQVHDLRKILLLWQIGKWDHLLVRIKEKRHLFFIMKSRIGKQLIVIIQRKDR